MSKHDCEAIRQLLAEAQYEELEAHDEDVLREHVATCEPCAERQLAYRAVRVDLQDWDDVEPHPSRVTFVTMSASARAVSWTRAWSRPLAVAASFVLGIFLTAAVVNSPLFGELQPTTTPIVEQSAPAQPVAGPRPGTATPAGARQLTPVGTGAGQVLPMGQPGAPKFMTQADLEAWLDRKLSARGVPTGQQPVAVSSLAPEQVTPLIEQLIAERDRQSRALLQQMVADSEVRQREQVDSALAGLYQAFDSQRTNDLLFLASELGLLQESTGLELQRTNAAIDYLITQVAQREEQRSEPRDDQ